MLVSKPQKVNKQHDIVFNPCTMVAVALSSQVACMVGMFVCSPSFMDRAANTTKSHSLHIISN